jgi:hypothetical protein
MKELQMPKNSGLPKDFLEKFWLEPEDFKNLLARCQSKGLFFTVTIPDEDHPNTALLDAVNQVLAALPSRGGPGLPEPQGKDLLDPARHWEFLTCKVIKASASKLRAQKKDQKGKKAVIQISSESTAAMLAPVDYSVQYATKTFGFKNPLRKNESEPEKFVAIGV